MKKYNINKIMKSQQRAPLRLIVKSVHISAITRKAVIKCSEIRIASKTVNVTGDIRMSLTMRDFRQLRGVANGTQLKLNGLIVSSKFCMWVCRPRNLRKVQNPFLMLNMQKYIRNRDLLVEAQKKNFK